MLKLETLILSNYYEQFRKFIDWQEAYDGACRVVSLHVPCGAPGNQLTDII